MNNIENNENSLHQNRYFLHLCYDGHGYCGWQTQPNGISVQSKINDAISTILSERIKVTGCGRTDAGVHATDYYAHFQTEKVLDDKFVYRVNSILPKDISIYRLIPVHEKAHSRFDATLREYEYHIHFEKIPFLRTYSHQMYERDFNWEKVMEATALIPTFSDFTSLCRPSDDFKTNICSIKYARWDKVPTPFQIGHQYSIPTTTNKQFAEGMIFTIASNRFLRGMVRKIVGTLFLIGREKLSIQEFKEKVENKEDFIRTILAPPQGLYLTKVEYPYITNENPIIL